MLRFIRKFQLLILVVGGSLLMVVFLLQPVLTRLSPSPLKAKIAKLGDGSNYTRADIQRANVAISLLKRVNPRALAPRSLGGLGLDPTTESNIALHWLLLVKQAENAGLVGEAGDGVSWINELASAEALIQTRAEAQQGLIRSEIEAEQRLNELSNQIAGTINRNATLSAGIAGGTLDDVYRILAQARGVYRLLSAIQTMPSFSDINAIYAAHGALDAVAINAALLDSSLVVSSVPDPSDELLQAFFDNYKAQAPNDNEFRIGYTQPTRIQLGWITLDKNVFMNTVKVDRIELNKIWRQDREKYTEEFSVEKPNLERQYREEVSTDMMILADRVIRAQVLAHTKGLPQANGILTLPDDWNTRQPNLETIAAIVVERVNEQFSTSLPTPAIAMIGDRWLNSNDLTTLPGFGSSNYRIGSRQLPAIALPQFFELTEANTTGLDVQVGLPLVDPASEDFIGNRYYAMILGVRPKGPADTIEDVTRDQVVSDYKAIEAFNILSARIDELKAAIASTGSLDSGIELATGLATNPDLVITPRVYKNILVGRDAIGNGNLTTFVDPSLNTEEFRGAVIDAASHLDPLANPEDVAINPIAVVIPLPASRSVAVSVVIAPRPVSIEQFRSFASRIIASTAQRELVAAATDLEDPFSFAALSNRYGLVRLDNDDEDGVDTDEAESESESAEASAEG